MELNIAIKLTKISWLTRISIGCALISSLLSLVSLFSPHWICAKEVDWPRTTMHDHRHDREVFDKFKDLTSKRQTENSYKYNKMEETADEDGEWLLDDDILDLNVTLTPEKFKVNGSTHDLGKSPLNNATTFTQDNSTTSRFQNSSVNNTSASNHRVNLFQDSEETTEQIEMSSTSVTPISQTIDSDIILYEDSEAINEEIELFLFNESDTSKLVRYTVYCGLWSCCVRSTCRSIYAGLDGWLIPVRVLHGFSTTCVLLSLICCCLLACVTTSCWTQINLLRTTCFLLVFSEVLIWTSIAVFVTHYFHQHMVLFEDRWLGWSFYIFPLAGAILLPSVLIMSLKLIQCKHSDKTEYLLDTVTT